MNTPSVGDRGLTPAVPEHCKRKAIMTYNMMVLFVKKCIINTLFTNSSLYFKSALSLTGTLQAVAKSNTKIQNRVYAKLARDMILAFF